MTARLGFVIAMAGTPGCTSAARDPGELMSYRDDIQPIWDRWCNRCHNFQTPHLVAGEADSLLTGSSWFPCRHGSDHAPFVVPGEPASSFLVYKLTGGDPEQFWDREACDRVMPADQPGGDFPLVELDPDAVTKVTRWVEQGATVD